MAIVPLVVEDAYLALFDILPLKEFNDGKSKLTTLKRKHHLEKFSKKFPMNKWFIKSKAKMIIEYMKLKFSTIEKVIGNNIDIKDPI